MRNWNVTTIRTTLAAININWWDGLMISGQFKTLSIVKGFLVHFLREIKKLYYKKYMKMARCKSVPLYKANTREFKIRRLRTTTTVKHATAYDQNHVTVHFSCVVLRLRWVVELFRVVGTTEDILLVFCRLGNSRISSFHKKSFQFTCFKWEGSEIWKFCSDLRF